MLRFSPLPAFSRLLSHRAVLTVIGLAVLTAVSVPLIRNLSRQYYAGREIKELEQEVAALSGRNEELKGLVDYLGSDRFIDEEARRNLNMLKKGEELVVVRTDGGPPAAATGTGETSPYRIRGLEQAVPAAETGNPSKWWRYFFGDNRY